MNNYPTTPKHLYTLLKEDTQNFFFDGRKEGMQQVFSTDSCAKFLVNRKTKQAWTMVDDDGQLVLWGTNDIDASAISHWPDWLRQIALDGIADHYFGIEDYHNGVALVIWTVEPDGSYDGDDSGFGMTNEPEVNLYAYINKKGRILVPFRPMTNEQRIQYEQTAIKLAHSPSAQ